MIQAKTEEQKKWVKNFINSLPFFDKERRFAPCLYCDYVTEDGVKIVRKYSEGSGWDKVERTNITYVSFDNIERMVDYLRSVNKPKKSELDISIVAPNMIEPVETWLAYKKEKGQSYKPTGFKTFYKKLCELSGNNPQVAMAIIEQSMQNNYAGIFPLRNNNNGNYGRETITDKIRRTVEEANMFSEQLRSRIGEPTDVRDGDDAEVW